MISVLLVSFVILSCGSAKKAENMRSEQKSFSPGPKAIIYQTKEDYSKLVPIILSADKKTIESYPDVKDVYFNGSLAYPTQLHKGFWLDNRGINANVVFINLTYEAYSKLPKTPSPEELIKMVGDTQPIISMYTCGPRSSFQDIVKELNTMIDSDDFSTFIKIK
jgi:hypothetical protein